VRETASSARALDPAARLQHALDLAYEHLSRRDRTVSEMRRYLEGKKVEPGVIQDVLATLGEQRYLDDARYAERFCDDRRQLDGWGSERIELRLRAAGVDDDVVAAALGEQGAEDELAAAVEVLRRRVRTAPRDERGRQRALGMLLRRGYELELAHDAIRRFEHEAA
jgi:regulatory protein